MSKRSALLLATFSSLRGLNHEVGGHVLGRDPAMLHCKHEHVWLATTCSHWCQSHAHMCGWQLHVLIDANHVDMLAAQETPCGVCHTSKAQETSCVSCLSCVHTSTAQEPSFVLCWRGISPSCHGHDLVLHIKTFPSSCSCSLHMSEGNLSFSQSVKIQKKTKKIKSKIQKHLWSSGSARWA